MKRPSPPDVKMQVNGIHVKKVSESSGLFFEGPAYTNQWRSINKLNKGLNQTGQTSLTNVRSIILDNDDMDTYDQKET